jgi:hypothetical protein
VLGGGDKICVGGVAFCFICDFFLPFFFVPR